MNFSMHDVRHAMTLCYCNKTYLVWYLLIVAYIVQVVIIVYPYELAWFVKYRGSSAHFIWCFFAFKSKFLINTQFGEPRLSFANHLFLLSMLSSNTKKGEIERTYPSPQCFDVC